MAGIHEQVKTKKIYLNILYGDVCRCGQEKIVEKAFCYPCFKNLPLNLQEPLYRFIGRGFEQAYDEALEYLKGDRGEPGI